MLPARIRISIVSAAVLLFVAAEIPLVSAGPVVALEANDNIPGEPMIAWNIEGNGEAFGDRYDVYSVQLVSGAPVRFACTAGAAQDFNIYLYPSTATNIEPSSQRIAGAARVWAFHGIEEFDFTPETTGTYYLLVDTASGIGAYSLSRQCIPSLSASGAGSITLGQTLRVDGALMSLDPAASVGGKVVHLQMSSLDEYLPPLQTWTGSNGAFSFSVQPTVGIIWYVSFDGATGLAAAASDEHVTDVANPGSPGTPGTSVGGTLNGVVKAGARALEAVSVQVGSMAPVRTGADGAYAVSGIVPGTFSVTFARSGYVTATVSDVEFRAGETVRQDVVLLADPSMLPARLTGSVTASGAPLAGVSVKVGSMQAVGTGVDGEYVVSDIAPGSYAVTFSKPGYVQQTLAGVTFAAGGSVTKNATLLPDRSLDASGALSGTVRSSDGLPLGSVDVRVGSVASTATGTDGTYRVSGIVPGNYEVTFAKAGYVARVLSDVSIAANTSVSLDTTLLPTSTSKPPTTPTRSKLRVVITRRSPSRTVAVYRRRAGIVRYTLAATVRTSRGAVLRGQWIYLQTRANTQSGWKNSYRLRTDRYGRVERRFLVRRASTRYFRWYAPATKTTHTARSKQQRVSVR